LIGVEGILGTRVQLILIWKQMVIENLVANDYNSFCLINKACGSFRKEKEEERLANKNVYSSFKNYKRTHT
jgi:hypothetical protein